MHHAIISVEPMSDYTVSVCFKNGERGVLDMKQYLEFGVFRRLKEVGVFQRVRVAFDTIEWDVGVDLDPEFVYAKCVRIDTVLPPSKGLPD